jgi:SAM-dependent methyltransferase
MKANCALPPDFYPEATETARFYEQHIKRFGYGFRALGFGRRASQEKRFAAALALGSFHGKKVLDVGCGFGDLFAFLHARGIECDYTGIDLVRPMIQRCRTRFRNTSARFYIGDALTFVTGEPYDYVVASGIFGYNARDTRERVRPTLEHLFSLAHIGMAVNFLSCRAPTRSPGRLYLQPADVLQFAFELTPAVKLDHTYLPNDFTLCLYRKLPWEAD